MTERKRAHQIIRKAFEEAGVVDGFYAGVMLDGKDLAAFQVGIPDRKCPENVERVQRVLGVVEGCKFLLLKSMDEQGEYEEDENAES